jgi:hypothetical protein
MCSELSTEMILESVVSCRDESSRVVSCRVVSCRAESSRVESGRVSCRILTGGHTEKNIKVTLRFEPETFRSQRKCTTCFAHCYLRTLFNCTRYFNIIKGNLE